MEANANCDLVMLYEDSKNQMPDQGVLDQTLFFFFKKKERPNTPTPS